MRGGDARGCGVGCGGGRRQDAVGVTDGVPWQVRAYALTYVGVEGRGRSDRQEAKEVVRQRGRKRGEMSE